MGVIGLEKAMTLVTIRKGFFAIAIFPFHRSTMNDKMGPSKVFATTAYEVNGEEVGDEHVEKNAWRRDNRNSRRWNLIYGGIEI